MIISIWSMIAILSAWPGSALWVQFGLGTAVYSDAKRFICWTFVSLCLFLQRITYSNCTLTTLSKRINESKTTWCDVTSYGSSKKVFKTFYDCLFSFNVVLFHFNCVIQIILFWLAGRTIKSRLIQFPFGHRGILSLFYVNVPVLIGDFRP